MFNNKLNEVNEEICIKYIFIEEMEYYSKFKNIKGAFKLEVEKKIASMDRER